METAAKFSRPFCPKKLGLSLAGSGILLASAMQALGQPIMSNSWTNPASARWENNYWSLGVLPASNQSIYVTNTGYKAVGIFDTTVTGYPTSLTISNLEISAPSSGLSTVLLNYTGLAKPLKVLNDCHIGANGTFENDYGSLEVHGQGGGSLRITGEGQFRQNGGLTVASIPIHVDSGTLACTNGNMTIGDLSVGVYGQALYGSVYQDGGSVAANSVAVNGGGYSLYNGVLYSGLYLSLDSASSGFYQFGGTNFGDLQVGNAAVYALKGGFSQGNVASAGGAGQIMVEGGTMSMSFIDVTAGMYWPSGHQFWLRSGQVRCGTLNIGGNGQVGQDAGSFIVTNNLDLRGMYFNTSRGIIIEHAGYDLSGGVLTTPSMSMGQFGQFVHYNGSNEVSGSLSFSNSTYLMYNGRVDTTYTGVGFQGGFIQDGGTQAVNGVLSVSGNYDLSGGGLTMTGLYLRGLLNLASYYSSAYFYNSGLTDLGGEVHCSAHGAYFGQVQLLTNAIIQFSGGTGVVNCANSSAVAWGPNGFLVLSNWSQVLGSANHIYFGSNASGLTPSQFSKIRFVNPGGMAPGYYYAQIMPDGEIVPVPRQTLQSSRSGSNLVLTWSGSNYQLLSATNVNGPYQPVSGAVSPYTIDMRTAPQRFFILSGP